MYLHSGYDNSAICALTCINEAQLRWACTTWALEPLRARAAVEFSDWKRGVELPVRVYSVEKLQNRGALYFRYRSKISKTAAKFSRPDSQALQDRDNRKLATPSAKISETISMRRKFLNQRQMGSFSTVSALSRHSLSCSRRQQLPASDFCQTYHFLTHIKVAAGVSR